MINRRLLSLQSFIHSYGYEKNTSVLLFYLVELSNRSGTVPTLILRLVTRIRSFHDPHHFVKKHNIVSLYLSLPVLLLLNGLAVRFME